MTEFASPTEQLFIGAAIAMGFKFIWDRWLSKSARVTADKCADVRAACKEGMLSEFYKHKTEVNKVWDVQAKVNTSRTASLVQINSKINRTNILLEALIGIQLEFCKVNPDLNCDNLTALLIKQGVEIKTVDAFPEKIEVSNGE